MVRLDTVDLPLLVRDPLPFDPDPDDDPPLPLLPLVPESLPLPEPSSLPPPLR